MCWFYNGNTQGLTESGFMEKSGIEPATPGLQGIGLSPTPQRLDGSAMVAFSLVAHNPKVAGILGFYN